MIDKKRVLTLSGLIFTAIGAAILYFPIQHSLQKQLDEWRSRPRPVLAPPSETKAIISSVLEHLDIEGAPPPPPAPNETLAPQKKKILVIADESACFRKKSLEPIDIDCDLVDQEWLEMSDLNEIAPLKLRKELFAANREPHKFQLDDITHTINAPSREIREILRKEFWNGFYRKYPDTAGFAQFSRPVLSQDKHWALIYISYYCDRLCGYGALALLEMKDGKWVVLKDYGLWQS